MRAEPLRPKLKKYLNSRRLTRKFDKQLTLFLLNPKHPSLNTELLEPKEYRVIFLFINPETIEIVDINDHYQ